MKGDGERKGKESVTGRKARTGEGRGPGMTWRKAREEETEKREKEIAGGRRERDGARLDVRSAGNKDNSMQ